MVYSLCFFSPTQALPALLQNNFNYIIPNDIVVHDLGDDDVVPEPYGEEDNVINTTPDGDGFLTADDDTDEEPTSPITKNDSDSSGPSATKIFKPDSEYESSTTSSSSTNS